MPAAAPVEEEADPFAQFAPQDAPQAGEDDPFAQFFSDSALAAQQTAPVTTPAPAQPEDDPFAQFVPESPVAETEKAVAETPKVPPEVQDIYDQSKAQQAIERKPDIPEVANVTAQAAIETGKGFVPRSVSQGVGMFTPVSETLHDITQGVGAVKDWIQGKPIDDVVKERFPESQRLAEAEKTPAWSKERFELGFETVAQMLVAGGIAKSLTTPHVKTEPEPIEVPRAPAEETIKLYHATPASFEQFDVTRATPTGAGGKGVFFSTEPQNAAYGDKIVEVNVPKSKIATHAKLKDDPELKQGGNIDEILQKRGYAGVEGPIEGEVILYNPNEFLSAQKPTSLETKLGGGETDYAIKEGEIPKGSEPEYPGATEVRATTEAGRGDRNAPSGETPPVEPSSVRLYHGSASGDVVGSDFSPYLDYAQGYADKGSTGKVYYVDIPKDAPFLKWDEGTDVGKGPTHLINQKLPTEVAQQAKPLESVPVPAPTEPVPPSEQAAVGPNVKGFEAIYGKGEIKPGESLSPEEIFEQGQADLAAGTDPYAIADRARTGDVSPRELGQLAAEHHRLITEAARAEGTPEYEAKYQTAKDFAQNMLKPAGTKWHQVGMGLQVKAPVDFSNLTGFRQAFEERFAKEMTPDQVQSFSRIAKDVARTKAEDLNTLKQTGERVRQRFKSVKDISFEDAVKDLHDTIETALKDCVL